MRVGPLDLIQRRRTSGVLVDANLVVLYIVGLVNPARIGAFKRTQQYTRRDFELVVWLISCFTKVITTPHVLTEVSNLTGNLVGRERAAVRILIARVVDRWEEVCDEGATVVRDACLVRLGLTDAAIATLSQRGTPVLTDDSELYTALAERGADVLDFRHVRAQWT